MGNGDDDDDDDENDDAEVADNEVVDDDDDDDHEKDDYVTSMRYAASAPRSLLATLPPSLWRMVSAMKPVSLPSSAWPDPFVPAARSGGKYSSPWYSGPHLRRAAAPAGRGGGHHPQSHSIYSTDNSHISHTSHTHPNHIYSSR